MGLRQEDGEMEDSLDYAVRLSQENEQDWEKGQWVKVLSAQAWGPEFISPEHT